MFHCHSLTYIYSGFGKFVQVRVHDGHHHEVGGGGVRVLLDQG